MVITVPLVRVVEVALDQVVYMVPMGNGFVPAAGSVHMSFQVPRTLMCRGAVLWISLCYADNMFIRVIAVRIVKVPVVQIADVVVMHQRSMTAFKSMWMSVIFVLGQVTIGHCVPP
jgi:hypothetical protein